jgi:hypothetical protein
VTVDVDVTGGTDGIAADCEAMVELARQFGAIATDAAGAALCLHGYLIEPAILASALLDPAGCARFEAALLGALDGIGGLTWAGAQCTAIDAELRAGAQTYAHADSVWTGARELGDGLLGVPKALASGATTLARTGSPARAGNAVVDSDPEIADLLAHTLGVAIIAGAAAQTMPDGRPIVRSHGVDGSPVAARPPRQLPDLLANLARRNHDAHHGEIDVRILTSPDGTRRAIVDVTGTKSWTPAPTEDITSLSTNARALFGKQTAYEQGVLDAMAQAGVRHTDEVMLVGHSQGGMVAANAARDAVASGRFHVTHVVTAGAPIGLVAGTLPRSVRVLALENHDDVVPHLDGRRNPDLPNVTTVVSDRGDGTVGGNHDLDTAYRDVAADAQQSKHRSVRDYLAGCRGFFEATEVVTHTFQIQRDHG